MLTLWAIDPTGTARGALEPYEAKAILRHNDVSTYAFTLDGRDPLARRLTKGWSILATDTGIQFSGAIRGIKTELNDAEHTITITGRDELHRLADRIIYPNPAQAATSQTRARYDARGAAEEVLKTLVNLNAGPAALPARRSPSFEVEQSSGIGSRVAISERFSNLLAVAQKIATAGGLSFSAVRDESNRVILRTYPVQDRTRQVRLQATGGTSVDAPEATTVILGGQGQGAERQIIESTTTYGWGHLVEIFKDRRDTDEQETLHTDAAEALADTSEKNAASFELTEADGARFGVDYRLGDTVSVELGHVSLADTVRQAEVTWTPLGREIKISVGVAEQPRWSARTRDLDARLRALETRE